MVPTPWGPRGCPASEKTRIHTFSEKLFLFVPGGLNRLEPAGCYFLSAAAAARFGDGTGPPPNDKPPVLHPGQ